MSPSVTAEASEWSILPFGSGQGIFWKTDLCHVVGPSIGLKRLLCDVSRLTFSLLFLLSRKNSSKVKEKNKSHFSGSCVFHCLLQLRDLADHTAGRCWDSLRDQHHQ